ncbi:TonB family protein, partial [Roseomonas sp. GC11]|uniref:energy transducer TonB n=1 Tax=Roseomonas sp. GC11 TaxID=2950546 RepID=UPI00210A1BE4
PQAEAAPPPPPAAPPLPVPPPPAPSPTPSLAEALPPAPAEREAVTLPPPPPPAPLPDLSESLASPTPLRLAPPRQQAPRPPQPEAPPQRNPFAGMTMLPPQALTPRVPQPRPPSQPGRPGALDLAMGAVPQYRPSPNRQGSSSNTTSMTHVGGAQPGADWGRAFQAWVQRRGFYPPQAAMNNEDGSVVLRLTVARDGRILEAQIISRSGSRWLDAGAMSLFRDQIGPAFPYGMEGESTTLNFTIHYNIIYR